MNVNAGISLGIKKIIVYAMVVISFILFISGSWIALGDRTARSMIGQSARSAETEISLMPESYLEDELGGIYGEGDAKKIKKKIVGLLHCMEDGALSPVETMRMVSSFGDIAGALNISMPEGADLFGSDLYGSFSDGEISAAMRGATVMMMFMVIAVTASFVLSLFLIMGNRGAGPVVFATIDTIILFLFLGIARISGAQVAQNMDMYDAMGAGFSGYAPRAGAGGIISALLAIGACILWGMVCSESRRSGVPIPWIAARRRNGMTDRPFNGVPYGHPGSNADMWNPQAGSRTALRPGGYFNGTADSPFEAESRDPGPVCPRCGTQLRSGSRFCTACGNKLYE